MKKFLLVLFLFFASPLNAFAQPGISFVYINGSNFYDSKINKWYIEKIQNLHPYIKSAFEQNPFTQQHFLKNGQYFIEENPVMFFWGDKCYRYSTQAKQNFSISKGLSTCIARQIRFIATNVLHDVFWAQQHSNMHCILDSLNKTVKAESQRCNKVVLYGYSSGSIIAYEYLLQRTPYINIADFFNAADVSKEQRDFAMQHPMKNTCMAALEKNLAVFSADGHFVFDKDLDSFKNNYVNLNKDTDEVCTPNNTVIGVVNLASPLALIISDISDNIFKLTYYNSLLYKYIFENGMFWISASYQEDALSFPCAKNLTSEEVEAITNLDIKPCDGFIYDQSKTRGGVRAMTHIHYLSSKKALSKIIVKTYVNGYKYQYADRYKPQTLNRCKREFTCTP